MSDKINFIVVNLFIGDKFQLLNIVKGAEIRKLTLIFDIFFPPLYLKNVFKYIMHLLNVLTSSNV